MQGTSAVGEPGYKEGTRGQSHLAGLSGMVFMDVLGIDISKRRFDVALLVGRNTRQGVFPNTEAGFQELMGWLDRHRPVADVPLHACMEATGNWGLDLAE